VHWSSTPRRLRSAHSRLQQERRMHATALSGRTLRCACCHTEVLVCADCERGQRYCSAECCKQARLASQRRASRVYQNSRVGRCNHARRQQRLRVRQRESKREQQLNPKNSDSSVPFQEACTGDLLAPRINVRPAAPPKTTPTWHCHWCARPLASRARRSWLIDATSEPNCNP
jgi:hypothetical protein